MLAAFIVGLLVSVAITWISNALYEHSARTNPENTPGTSEYALLHGASWEREALLDRLADREARRLRRTAIGTPAPRAAGSPTARFVARGLMRVVLRIWQAWRAVRRIYTRLRTTC